MENKWYSLRCRIALAKELEIAPDDLDINPVLEMVEEAQFYGTPGDRNANLMPDNNEQEQAVINQYYSIVLNKIFQNEFPFEGFLENAMQERGLI